MNKEKLKKEVWSKDSYYKTAGEGSMDLTHPAMKKLKELSKNSVNLLDMGCGEGTRVAYVADKNTNIFGIDISAKAIELARKNYPKYNFLVGDLEKLPFPDVKFDLVYSAFVFEHLEDPEKVIKEGIRVLKKGGKILIAAPNFGAPNRASPPFKGNRFFKLLRGLIFDFLPGSRLSWNKVTPIADKKSYDIDWDTTIEPYIGSLIKYMKKAGLNVIYKSSCWEIKENGNIIQKIFKYLGEKNIYPFKNWGPHLLLVARK